MDITANSGSQWHPKYIDPATDFGFKRIFKDEEITRGFLNDLLQKDDPKVHIKSVKITDGESDETSKDLRRVVYDVHCVTDTDEEFVIEMQNDSQDFFAERIVFYLARAASRQQSKGYLEYFDADNKKKKKNWDYHLKNIYGVFFMNFKDKNPKHAQPLSHFAFMEKTKHYVDTDVVQYWKIQMPFYREMKESDCKDSVDKWIFNLSNMSTMETNLAFTDEQPLFMRLQQLASYSALTPQQQLQYDDSFHNFMCYHGQLNTKLREGEEIGFLKGEKKGIEKGIQKGRTEQLVESIKNLISSGFDFDKAVEVLKIPADQISELRLLVLDNGTI